MADLKISQLTAISVLTPATDVLPVVDVGGVTKKITTNQILGSGGVATLASATITGAATVGTTLGVTGVSTFAAGTALLPALTTTGDTNTGIYYPAADTFAVTTAGVERYRVDSAGQLGIGVTPSATDSTYYQALELARVGQGLTCVKTAFTGTPNSWLSNNSYATYSSGTVWKYAVSSQLAAQYRLAGGEHQWFNAPSGTAGNAITFTQALTLDASGNLLLGKTVSGAFTDGCQLFPAGTISIGHPTGTGSGAAYSIFAYNGVKTGDITQNGTTGVLYNTVSDYRLKESVKPISNGLARVNSLKPSSYNWKSDGSVGEGFIAHELASVVSAAVTGEKDAVNEDGSINAQSVDMSRIVPILVAAIQELTAEVNALKNA